MSTPSPKYMTSVLGQASAVKPGTVTDVFVLHDAGCALLAGAGVCTCEPEVTLGYVLWGRRTKRHGWGMHGRFPTERAAHAAIRGSGDWLVLPTGKEP